LWEGLAIPEQQVKGRQRFYFVQADLRMDRTQEQAEQAASPTCEDLRRMRLGLTTTLLRDGAYFGFDRGDCLHGQLWWFDEYNADLGRPVGEFRKDPFGPATFSRQYENGLVVVNAGAEAAHLELDSTAQDVTTKAIGRAFEIPPQDGRILLKTSKK
jgi:hypothetical protein